MAVSTQVVRFTKETSGTTNVTQDISLNFTPKAIIVFSDCSAGNNTVAAHYQWSQGFSDGTNSACVTITSDDADAVSDTQYYYSNNSVYVRMNETNNANVVERATCAFITNGVRLTWAVASTAATYITIWAIGGDDITNAKVNTVTINRVGAGTQNYTGLGFTPTGGGHSALFTLHRNTITLNAALTGATLSFGCAISTSKRWAIDNTMEEAADPSDTWRVTATDKCIHCLNRNDGTLVASADFSAWITDGFTLNWSATGSNNDYFSYLVIEGGTWDVGTLTSPTTATNNVDYSVSVSSRTLRGIMIAGCASTVSGTIDTHAIVAVGAADGTNQATISCIDEDAQLTMDSYRINNATNIVNQLTLNGAAENIATFDSFGTNSFRLDHTTQVAFSQLYGWVVVADYPTSQQYPVSISETSVSVSEELAIQTEKVATQVIRFQKSTGANGTTQDVTLNFTPKAIIVISSGEETDNTLSDHQQLSIGFSDGTTQGVVSMGTEDNANPSDAARIHRTDSVFCRLSETAPNTTIVCRGSAAFSSNKVTFTWTVNDAVATYITMWAFAGIDIQAKVINADIGRTTAGTTDYTGLGFTPQGNDHTAVFNVTGVVSAYDTHTGTANITMGVATRAGSGSGKSWCVGCSSETGQSPSDTWRALYTNRDYVGMDGAGSLYTYGYLNAWITNGFQVYYDGPPAVSTIKNTFLVIDGGNWDTGSLDTPTAITSNVDYTVAVNSQPLKGLLLGTWGTGGSNGIGTFSVCSLGLADGTSQAVESSIDRDAQSDSKRITAGNAVYAAYNSLGTITDKGNFDSFGTNNFRLDYTVKSTNVHKIGWVVLAEQSTVQQYSRPISETSVSVSESLDRLQIKLKPINDTTLQPYTVVKSDTIGDYDYPELTDDTGIGNSITFSINSSSVKYLEYITQVGQFTKLDWEGGDWVAKLRVTSANSNIDLEEVGIARLSYDLGTVRGEKSITPFQTLSSNQVYSYTIAWDDGTQNPEVRADIDIIYLYFYFRNNAASSQNINLGVNLSDGNDELITPILLPSGIEVSGVVTGVKTQLVQRSISESSVSVSESLARLQVILNPISETSVSVSEELAKIQTLIKTLSDTSVDIDQTLARVQTLLKPISETSTSISEELARIQTRKFILSEADITISELLTSVSEQLYDRPISETIISVSEELARIQTLIKSISNESAVTVPDESLTKISTYSKSIDNESTVSVSEVLARLQTIIKTLAETSVSVPEETVTRIQSLIKLISDTPTITVDELLTSGLSFTKSILESPSITTDDSIVRLPLHLRPVSETPTITTDDSITRWISISYTIAEPSISIEDLVAAGVPIYLRTISESTVDTNDTIAKIMIAIKAISETPSLTIEDTIARIQTLLKTIADEDPISVSESLQAGLLMTISIVESRIKWYYSLLTRKISG